LNKGSFAQFKVVKVTAPAPQLLTCHLKLSDKMDYEYYKNETDSVTVFSTNDTLYISYAAKANTSGEERRDYHDITVKVNLPAFDNLVVDGTEVVIDSLPASANMSVTLRNNGVIKDGSEKKKPGSTKVSPAVKATKKPIAQVTAKRTSDSKNAGNNEKIDAVQTDRLDLFNVDTKYLLIYSLLDRI